MLAHKSSWVLALLAACLSAPAASAGRSLLPPELMEPFRRQQKMLGEVAQISWEFYMNLSPEKRQEAARLYPKEAFLKGDELTPELKSVLERWIRKNHEMQRARGDPLWPGEFNINEVETAAVCKVPYQSTVQLRVWMGTKYVDADVAPLFNLPRAWDEGGLWDRQAEDTALLIGSLTFDQVQVAGTEEGLPFSQMSPYQQNLMRELAGIELILGPSRLSVGPEQDFRLKYWVDEETGVPGGELWFGQFGDAIDVRVIGGWKVTQLEQDQFRMAKELWSSLDRKQKAKATSNGLQYAQMSEKQRRLFARMCRIRSLLSGERLSLLGKTEERQRLEAARVVYDPKFRDWWGKRREAILLSLDGTGEWIPLDGKPLAALLRF